MRAVCTGVGSPPTSVLLSPTPCSRTGLNRTLRKSGPAFFCETRPLGLDKLHCALKSESLSHGFITRHHCPPGCWAQVPGLTVEGRAAGDPGPLLVPGLSGPACPSWPALPACLAHSGPASCVPMSPGRAGSCRGHCGRAGAGPEPGLLRRTFPRGRVSCPPKVGLHEAHLCPGTRGCSVALCPRRVHCQLVRLFARGIEEEAKPPRS